jgi:acetate kinase
VNVVTINCGSSSLKLRLVDVAPDHEITLAEGAVESIGPHAALSTQIHGEAPHREQVAIDDWAHALRRLFQMFGEDVLRSVQAVGHRVVHGGVFDAPVLIDDDVIGAIRAARRFAPLHTGPSLEGIRAGRKLLRDVPHVAVFDTTFHATMPDVAAHYALPRELSLQLGIRRYGYHGIAHRSMSEQWAALNGVPLHDISIVTLQLGNGCSAAAVRGGRSIDTSMGFTPTEGLVMSTRSGDVDPSVITYLQRAESMSADDIDNILNHTSGLLGVSGKSADMQTLLEQEARGHAQSHAAVEMFCYRVRKYIGAYLAVLGGAQAVVFGGGIGERSPEIRLRICGPLEPLGLRLDREANASHVGVVGRFSSDGSAIAAYVIPADEARVIARDTFELISPSAAVERAASGEARGQP